MKKITALLALGLMTGAVHAQAVDPYGNIQIGNNTSISPPSDPGSPNTVKTGQIVIGNGASTNGQDAIAEGTGANAEGLEAMAKGKGAKASGNWAKADGAGAEATDINTTASGHLAKARDAGDTATGAQAETCVDGGGRATATGIQAYACGREATTTGAGGQATAQYATNNGAMGKATKEAATNVGAYGEAGGVSSTNVGSFGKATADRATNLGAGGTAAHYNSVSIGYGTKTTQANEVAMGNRKVTQVANGSISQGSTDAVNGGQVWEILQNLPNGSNFDETLWNDRWDNINNRFGEVGKRIDGLGAQMGAMSMMAAAPGEGGLSVGVGYSGSSAAVAVGWSKRFNDRVSMAVGASFGGGNKAVIGVGLRIGGR
ncbi:YadA-like family protein [Stenotrophomonas sp. GD03937]|uniref:YadA-like family protein n=1 Tax=Stenotrophomonas sp. GD03937 TaxID=2975408 RepID=UPI0024484AD9|nr:YadA-like family protein [Stenotrophomonas sp. GD03937]MDH1274140.1 YadA-like family protein [Stenotrophomonas sp. GD03937]